MQRIQRMLRDWGFIVIVTVMSIGANLPEQFARDWGIERKYLLGGLIALVAISLVRYLKFTLILAVVILTVGANLPKGIAEELNINQDIMLFGLVAMVVISLMSRLFNMPSGLEPPQASERAHGALALFNAVSRGHVSVAQQVIRAGVRINVRTKAGQTPLMVAAAKGYSDLVQMLLDGGADATAADRNGNTALKFATRAGYTRTAEILQAANIYHRV